MRNTADTLHYQARLAVCAGESEAVYKMSSARLENAAHHERLAEGLMKGIGTPTDRKVMIRFARSLAILALGLFSALGFAQDDGLANGLLDIQNEWDHIHYQLAEEQQDAAFPRLEEKTNALVKQYPGRAEPLVWKAIVLSTHADVKGDLSAMNMVREARDLLEQAEKIDPNVLGGSIYTALGSLYYQAPGWPLGYGDDKKAETFLKKALAINPNDMDANFYYGDFLYRKGHYPEALSVLEKAMHIPGSPNRPLANEGRRKEIQTIIAAINDR